MNFSVHPKTQLTVEIDRRKKITMSSADPAWELSKENIVPLKKGRKVSEDVFAKDSEFKKIQQHYEELLEKHKGNGESLLQAYTEYYTSVRRASNNVSHGKLLLERATKELHSFDELKNDIRLAKLWIEYVRSFSLYPVIFINTLLIRLI